MKQSTIIILLAFAITLMFVKCQDIGQDPKPDSPVEIMSLDKEASDLRWQKFKSTFFKTAFDTFHGSSCILFKQLHTKYVLAKR